MVSFVGWNWGGICLLGLGLVCSVWGRMYLSRHKLSICSTDLRECTLQKSNPHRSRVRVRNRVSSFLGLGGNLFAQQSQKVFPVGIEPIGIGLGLGIGLV